MADTSPKTFPGFYSQIIDNSFLPAQISRFRPGLVGVTSKGPFDTPTIVVSLRDYLQTFGQPVTGAVNQDGTPSGNNGFFLADAVAMVSDFTNSITIVRVGNRYTDFATHDGSGSNGSYVLGTSTTNASAVYSLLNANPVGDLWLKIKQDGLASTVNVKVNTAGGGTISLLPGGDSLQASYSGATISYSKYNGAANSAEGIVYAYTYGTLANQVTDIALTTFGTVTGNKNDFQFTVQSNPGLITVGGIYKIAVPGNSFKASTSEVRVKQVINNTVFLETSDVTRIGYQAVPLQDTYTSSAPASLYRATNRTPFLWLEGKTAGEWANGANSTQGLYVKVRPGSKPGTKKLEVYENGALVETHDSLSSDSTSTDYYETRLALSQYVSVVFVNTTSAYHAANTSAPWDVNYYGTNAGTPFGLPTGAVNAGILSSAGTTYATGSQFLKGYNGNNAQEVDYIGQYVPETDTLTGLKAFEDSDNISVNILACPMDLSQFGGGSDPMSGIALMQEIARVGHKINAIGFTDVPPGLNTREAVDWHNGKGVYSGRPRIDDYTVAIFWNWGHITSTFTSLQKLVPPSLAALRCAGFTFQREKPWYAIAGYNRGWVPELNDVQYDRVSDDSKQAMYGNGNSVNPILLLRGRHYLFGERTMQVLESKLTAIHSVILVDYIVVGLAEIGRKFIFDPNDLELLVHIRLAFSEFLDKVRNERGLEDYSLIVDETNNTPDTRNLREVIIDLSLIPTDVAERIFLNATVRESGAQLNTVNA